MGAKTETVKHTPGPWTVKQYEDGRWGVRDPMFSICNLVENEYETEANARLIATAPDMKAALEQTISDMQSLASLTDDPAIIEIAHHVADRHADAITKAERKE